MHRKASFSPFDGNTGRALVRYARFTFVNELFKREGHGGETTKGVQMEGFPSILFLHELLIWCDIVFKNISPSEEQLFNQTFSYDTLTLLQLIGKCYITKTQIWIALLQIIQQL